jgi:coenzyme F420-reducing hydrogenase alpha subunit
MGELAQIGRGDRQELRRITKGRITIIKQELEAREKDLLRDARNQLRNEHKSALKVAERKVARIKEKVEKLNREAMNAYQELEDLGLEPDGRSYYYDKERLVEANVTSKWQPKDFDERYETVKDEVQRQRIRAEIQLDKQELSLLEELSVDALTSEAAREFLGQIPTVEQVLPAPNVQELVA